VWEGWCTSDLGYVSERILRSMYIAVLWCCGEAVLLDGGLVVLWCLLSHALLWVVVLAVRTRVDVILVQRCSFDGERGSIGHVLIFFVVVFAVGIRIADIAEVCPYPASGALKLHLSPLLEVVHAAACEEDDARWCVAFILFKIEIESQAYDSDELEEVDVEVVWLWTVRLPEQ
jgi:hypothetical protein